MITRLHHAQITSPPEGEATAREFYCEALGLPDIVEPATLAGRGGLRVRLGDQMLHIGVERGVERAATKAHLTYEVDDLATWRARLAAAGIVAIDSVPLPGYDRFECRDPFGNRLEFIQPLAPDARGTSAHGRD